MMDVVVYKPSPYSLVFIHDKLLGLRARVYHLSHETWAGLCVLTSCIMYRTVHNVAIRQGTSTVYKYHRTSPNDFTKKFTNSPKDAQAVHYTVTKNHHVYIILLRRKYSLRGFRYGFYHVTFNFALNLFHFYLNLLLFYLIFICVYCSAQGCPEHEVRPVASMIDECHSMT